MKHSPMKRLSLQNEKGNILVICVLIMMVITSLAIFGLNSSSIELFTSSAEMREKNNFYNAETGMKFAVSYFTLIYGNITDTTASAQPFYAVNATGVGMGDTISLNAGNIAVTSVPVGNTATSLQNLSIGTGGVVFTYAAPDPDPRSNAVNIPIALIEIRAIMVNPPAIATLSAEANNVPSRFHIGSAPEGYNNNLFASRNYCITSTALNNDGTPTNTVVQCGIVIAALRNSVVQLQGL